MANVNSTLSIHVLDDDGEKVSTPLFRTIADTTTLASLGTEAQTMATLADTLLDGKVFKIRICLEFEPTGMKSAPVTGSEVERTGLLNFDLTGQSRSWGLDLPAIAQDVLIGNKIDTTNSDVTAFVNHLTSNNYTDPLHNALNALNTAVKTFRKRRLSTKRT